MAQQDRDRLVALKKANEGLITQLQAAVEIGQSERNVRRLLVKLKRGGDGAVLHQLRSRPSNRQVEPEIKRAAVDVLSQKVYSGFGPTLASEYPRKEHGIDVRRSTRGVCDGIAREWRDRSHFFRVAAAMMRYILVDHARRHLAAKRGSGIKSFPLDEGI